jgi:tetratricopeptide (TPR) repeat protein
VTARRSVLEEQRDLALNDLAELEAQVATGDLDEQAAARLRDRYETDAATAIRGLARLDAPNAPADGEPPQPDRRGRGLAAAGGFAVVVAVGAAIALPRFLGDRPDGGFVTGNEAVAGQGRDRSEVTTEEMEQVVAANPDVVPMRLRLAHRYLDGGQMRQAFEHYMAVLEREPHPEALSHLGWILFDDGDVDLAIELLEASRQRNPGDAETLWFLANVQLYGRQDPDAALPLLQQLAARDDLGTQREQVEQTLQDARRLQDAP